MSLRQYQYSVLSTYLKVDALDHLEELLVS